MPPKFVGRLLGLRRGIPNIADASSQQSLAIAHELVQRVSALRRSPGPGQTAGSLLEEGVRSFLADELPKASKRPWVVDRRLLITAFRQYEHLARLDQLVRNDPTLRIEVGQDYLIKPDVTVGIGNSTAHPWLHAAISCKFTIRSDRVQNVRHEAVVLVRHRRGRLPHVVTVTAEPLPTRIASIARGTGEVDAVYHVCLPDLVDAVQAVGSSEQRAVLEEMIGQSRLFDLTELVDVLAV